MFLFKNELWLLSFNIIFPTSWFVIYFFKIGLRNKFSLRNSYIIKNIGLYLFALFTSGILPWIFFYYALKTTYFTSGENILSKQFVYFVLFIYAYLFTLTNLVLYEWNTYIEEISNFYFKRKKNLTLNEYHQFGIMHLYLLSNYEKTSRNTLICIEHIVKSRIINLNNNFYESSFFDKKILSYDEKNKLYNEILENIKKHKRYNMAGEILEEMK